MKNEIKYEGELNLNGFIIPCYVLEDGTRIVSGRGMQDAVKLLDSSSKSAEQTTGSRMAEFTNSKWFKSLIDNEKMLEDFKPLIAYKGNQKISGYQATTLADFCEIMLKARKAGKLTTERQKIISEQCDILLMGFARVGIIALVDEATGYQYTREKDELQQILKAYISPELLPWQKRFPDEYYKEIFRLNKWNFTVSGIGIKNRPGAIGTWTKKYVYNLLPKGVLKKLEQNTPRSAAGNKTARLHQSLTLDIGEPHLEKQLIAVITLMNASTTWDEFNILFNRKFYKELLEAPPVKRGTKSGVQHPGQQSMFDDDFGVTKAELSEDEKKQESPKNIEDASFNDILGAVIKVPPPKKDKGEDKKPE